MIIGCNNINNGKIDETKASISKYVGKPVGKCSVIEQTYRLSINDFDSRGDFSFDHENTQKRGSEPYY